MLVSWTSDPCALCHSLVLRTRWHRLPPTSSLLHVGLSWVSRWKRTRLYKLNKVCFRIMKETDGSEGFSWVLSETCGTDRKTVMQMHSVGPAVGSNHFLLQTVPLWQRGWRASGIWWDRTGTCGLAEVWWTVFDYLLNIRVNLGTPTSWCLSAYLHKPQWFVFNLELL